MVQAARQLALLTILGFLLGVSTAKATQNETIYWIKLKAANKQERTEIANTGVSIETIGPDYVVALGKLKQVHQLQKQGRVDVFFENDTDMMDFPKADSRFHTYTQVMDQVQKWASENPDIVQVTQIGKSTEGRALVDVKISTDPEHSSDKAGVVYMGGHHAREHLSVEMPMGLIEHLISQYRAGNADVVRWVQGREIHVIPMVNPDGLEFDIEGGRYHMWRKNRRKNNDGTFGVDLNRNYGYQWGTGGSSKDTESEVYMGPSAFSEPETQIIKNFVDTHSNITILLSFHTFSQLILYPWGYSYDAISDSRARGVYEKMAQTMAKWNGYTPQQSSELYIASGDTTDWAFAAHKIISFTFELDPGSMWEGGFYPGQGVIDGVIQKNLQPCLYLLEYADNPYRVLDTSTQFGVNLSWVK